MTESLKVAIYTDSYRPAMDGVVVYIDNIVKRLAELNHEVIVVTTGSRSSLEKTPEGFEILKTRGIKFPPYPQYTIGLTPFAVNREIIKRNVDVIHTQTPFSMGFSGRLASRHLDCAFLSTFHSLVFDETVISSYSRSNIAMTRRLARIIKRYLKWHYSKYDTVISPSEDIAGKIREIGIENVTVLNNGIDLKKFKTDLTRDEARERLGLDPDDKILLYLGRIGREKDLEILIDAHKYLDKENIRIMISGSGPHLEFYREYAKRIGADNIKFTGFVPEEEKILLYRSADIFCNPSDYEVQSTVDLEAMSLNTPILVPDKSSQVELALPGKSGEIFTHGNSESLADKASIMFSELDKYRPETVSDNFSIEHHVDRLIDLYKLYM